MYSIIKICHAAGPFLVSDCPPIRSELPRETRDSAARSPPLRLQDGSIESEAATHSVLEAPGMAGLIETHVVPQGPCMHLKAP